MSGYSEASITRTAQVPLEPDAAWISKPFSLRDLLDEVRSSLDAAPVMARPMRGAGCPAC
jgi:hypothetical protein